MKGNILAKPSGPVLVVSIQEEFEGVVLQVRLANDFILHCFNILQLLLRLSQPSTQLTKYNVNKLKN